MYEVVDNIENFFLLIYFFNVFLVQWSELFTQFNHQKIEYTNQTMSNTITFS